MGTMRHVRKAAIWTLGHKSKKPTRVNAYVDGEYCAQILANSIKNCRTSRVFHDPLSRLDLTAATQQPAAATQQHCCCYTAACCCCVAALLRSTVRWRGQTNIATNKQTNKHPGTTIRLTLCERDAKSVVKTVPPKLAELTTWSV